MISEPFSDTVEPVAKLGFWFQVKAALIFPLRGTSHLIDSPTVGANRRRPTEVPLGQIHRYFEDMKREPNSRYEAKRLFCDDF